MLNANANGNIDIYDYVNLCRYLILTITSVLLGYTIADFNPKFYEHFQTPKGQFCLIFTFLVTGLIRFKKNTHLYRRLFVMAIISAISVFILQELKKSNTP